MFFFQVSVIIQAPLLVLDDPTCTESALFWYPASKYEVARLHAIFLIVVITTTSPQFSFIKMCDFCHCLWMQNIDL